MKSITVTEKIKNILDIKKSIISARIFLTREDGITMYDSVQNHTTNSVSALVSGMWQASEALMGFASPGQDIMDFRLAFDTSSQGIFIYPLYLSGKKYFLGAIYQNCLNPGLLKRQLSLIKAEIDSLIFEEPKHLIPKKSSFQREGFLFQDISDDEIDRLFSVGK
jgi:hypothetical protein